MNRPIIFIVFACLVLSCNKNSITGRKQLSLYPESTLQQQALTQYADFLSKNKVLKPAENKNAQMLQQVGSAIAAAIAEYYAKKGIKNDLGDYRWEFNLIEDTLVNAWCMPGGKVVVYTGLLPVTRNEKALAVVLGHEITHAIAKHGNERMSQVAIAQGIQMAGDAYTKDKGRANDIFNNVFGPAAAVGVLLPNSRSQEYEADHYGLIFAAMAGYDPREAIPFWKRMAALSKGKKPPEFLATHPSDENRVSRIEKLMPEALTYYHPEK